MRKRNIPIQFWVTKPEHETFDLAVQKSGLSRSAYLRHLLRNLVPTDAPPPDYFAMMQRLNAIGSTLDRIATQARVDGHDPEATREAVTMLDAAIVEITNAVMLPRKVG